MFWNIFHIGRAVLSIAHNYPEIRNELWLSLISLLYCQLMHSFLMHPQTVNLSKPSTAQVTSKRFFSGMNNRMSSKIVTTFKSFDTHFTFETSWALHKIILKKWICFVFNLCFKTNNSILFLNVYPWYAFSSNQTGHSVYDKTCTHIFFLWYEQPYVFWACNCRENFWNIFHIECPGVLLSFALKGPEIGTNFWDHF